MNTLNKIKASRLSRPAWILLSLSLLGCGEVFAQPADSLAEKKKFITFSGSSALRWQFASRQGSGQQTPASFLIWEVNPTINIGQIPLGFNLLLSSYEDASRQRVNSAQIQLNFTGDRLLGVFKDRLQHDTKDIGSLNDIQQLNFIGDLRSSLSEINQQIEKLDKDKSGTSKKKEKREKKKKELSAQRQKLQRKIESLERTKTKLENNEKYGFLLKMRPADWKDPQKIKGALKQSGKLKKGENLLMAFRTFSIGNCVGNYSPLTFQGAQLNGVNIEFNPGWFYLAVVSGKIQRPVYAGAPQNSSFSRKFNMIKTGIGRPEVSHLFFTVIKSADDKNSLTYNDSITDAANPAENVLAGADLKLSFFHRKLQIDGEFMGSMSNNDLRTPKVNPEGIPGWALNFAEPRLSSYVSYAYTGGFRLDLFKDKTRVKANLRHIAPGFHSFGVPNLRNDVQRFEARVDQSLLKSDLTMGLFLRKDEDNLLKTMKRGTTEILAYGLDAGIKCSKSVFLRTSFAPYTQVSSLRNGSKVENKQLLINGSITVNTTVAKCPNLILLSYAQQQFISSIDSISSINNLITFSDNIQWSERVSTGVSISNNITTGLLNEESMLILGTDADVLVGKSLSVGGGYEYSQQQLVGTTHAFYALVAFPLTKWLRFETRGRFNQFASNDPSAYPGYNEIVATGSLRAQW